MRLKRNLSVLLIITMVLSACFVSQANAGYDYLVGPIDFTDAVGNTNTLGFSRYGQADLYAMQKDGSKVLKINRGNYTYDSWVDTPKYNSTGKDGVVVEFKLINTLYMKMEYRLDGVKPLITIDTNGDVIATDSGKILCNVKANEWYTYTTMIDYSTQTILFTVKDSSGTVLCNTPHIQSADGYSSYLAPKADSFMRFYMRTMPKSETKDYLLGFLDDFSIRAITDDDIDSIPEYAISNFKFSCADAAPGDVIVSADVLSIASDGQPMSLIVLLKDKASGELVSANADIQTANSAGKTLSAMVTIPDDGNEYEVYAHIWDTFINMNTLIKPINLK